MPTWNSSPHPISDIRDWKQLNRLELRPDFQRKSVWNPPAKIMLIDTILKNIPMPKIFLSAELRDGYTYRIVIDGQQRITAILDFLEDKFSLEDPYSGELLGLKYSELSKEIQDSILQYKLDFSEISNADDQELREIFHRVNKYTVALNGQELRIADFPGHFQDVAKKLSNHPFFDLYNIFSAAHRRRSLDIEYVSELLIVVVTGITNKKEALNTYYKDYMVWEENSRKESIEIFKSALDEIDCISSQDFNLKKTRFKQKADFYSLFSVVVEYLKKGKTLKRKEVSNLVEDLEFLDNHIGPGSDITDLKNYAVKCVSQANTSSSREWRKKFLRVFFNGTLEWYEISVAEAALIARILVEYDSQISDMCPSGLHCCECGEKFRIIWKENEPRQLSNASFGHEKCLNDIDAISFLVSLKSNQYDELAEDSNQVRLGFDNE